jgi:hypothetical protein
MRKKTIKVFETGNVSSCAAAFPMGTFPLMFRKRVKQAPRELRESDPLHTLETQHFIPFCDVLVELLVFISNGSGCGLWVEERRDKTL